MQLDHSVKKKKKEKKATFLQTLCINYEYAFRARPSRCLVAIGKPFCLIFFFFFFKIVEIPCAPSRGRFPRTN